MATLEPLRDLTNREPEGTVTACCTPRASLSTTLLGPSPQGTALRRVSSVPRPRASILDARSTPVESIWRCLTIQFSVRRLVRWSCAGSLEPSTAHSGAGQPPWDQVEMDGDVRLLGLRVTASQNPAGGFEGS
eukprot:g27222.t1